MKLNHLTTKDQFTKAQDIVIPDIFFRRVATGMADLDYVFGDINGMLPGSIFTIAAKAGCGKTTFLLQTEELLADKGMKVGYITGEESKEQLAFTCLRIGVKKVCIANLTNIDEICEVIEREKFKFCVIDSLPAMTTSEPMNAREREKYIAEALTAVAKKTECIIGIILHMTKGGTYKGGVEVAHIVDMNIRMNLNEEDPSIRDITVDKNRFGFAGQSSFVMNGNGFDFIKVESGASMETMGSRDRKPSKKDLVLEAIKEKGQMSQNELIALVGSVQYVNNITKELMLTGKITKEGKGGEALYAVVSK